MAEAVPVGIKINDNINIRTTKGWKTLYDIFLLFLELLKQNRGAIMKDDKNETNGLAYMWQSDQ